MTKSLLETLNESMGFGEANSFIGRKEDVITVNDLKKHREELENHDCKLSPEDGCETCEEISLLDETIEKLEVHKTDSHFNNIPPGYDNEGNPL